MVGVLSQIDRLLAGTHQQAAAELRGIMLPEQVQHTQEPFFSLTRADHAVAEAEEAAGPDAERATELTEAVAEEQDDDDFVFESLEPEHVSQKAFLSSLLPSAASELDNAAEQDAGGWENGESVVRKLGVMAKIVTHARVGNHWHDLLLPQLIVRILRRLLRLPPSLWQEV